MGTKSAGVRRCVGPCTLRRICLAGAACWPEAESGKCDGAWLRHADIIGETSSPALPPSRCMRTSGSLSWGPLHGREQQPRAHERSSWPRDCAGRRCRLSQGGRWTCSRTLLHLDMGVQTPQVGQLRRSRPMTMPTGMVRFGWWSPRSAPTVEGDRSHHRGSSPPPGRL